MANAARPPRVAPTWTGLSGQLSSSPGGVPDTGHEYTLAGAGQVSRLGRVTIRGDVAGTGFISRGHELMKIILSSSSGSVTVQAHSGTVKGFTAP